MTRRVFLLSLAGTRKMNHHNRQCAIWGRNREKNGMTEREIRFMDRRSCRRDPVLGWVSGLFWEA